VGVESDKSEMAESKNRATSIMERILLCATVIQNVVGLFSIVHQLFLPPRTRTILKIVVAVYVSVRL